MTPLVEYFGTTLYPQSGMRLPTLDARPIIFLYSKDDYREEGAPYHYLSANKGRGKKCP